MPTKSVRIEKRTRRKDGGICMAIFRSAERQGARGAARVPQPSSRTLPPPRVHPRSLRFDSEDIKQRRTEAGDDHQQWKDSVSHNRQI